MAEQQEDVGFWGVVLVPGENYRVTPPRSRVLRISSAALDVKASGGKKTQASLVIYDAVKSQEFFICTLISDVVPHTHLDLFFVGNREVTFRVHGNGNLHLTGYSTFLETDRILEMGASDDEVESGPDAGPNTASNTASNTPSNTAAPKAAPKGRNGPPKTLVQELRESELGAEDEEESGEDDTSFLVDEGTDDEPEPLAQSNLGKKSKPAAKVAKTAETKSAKPKQGNPQPIASVDDEDEDEDEVENGVGKKDDNKKRKAPELKKPPAKPQQQKKQKTQSPKPQAQAKKPQGKGAKSASSPVTKSAGAQAPVSCTECQKKFPNANAMKQHALAKHKAK